ncbi:MAG: hypothetical protein LBS48_04390 [Treponema sp.]|jgi:hypothetical protein|nr:hypothetical protein [Treponema sp.]
MGLLSKAAGKAPEMPDAASAFSKLDDMGKALRDRIRRLPPKKNSPYMALSFMKAYNSFQAGVCLYLNKGQYISYASVGLGIEKTRFPQDILYDPSQRGKKYFNLGSGDSLGLKPFTTLPLTVWAFPLDNGTPWSAVLLLGADESSGFNPEPVSLVVESVLDIINPQIDRVIIREKQDEGSEKDLPESGASVEASLIQYHKTNPVFGGILVNFPEIIKKDEKDDFLQKVSRMTSLFGMVTALPAGRCVVLLPHNIDRALIAHLLKNSLKTGILESFDANSPGEALEILRPYL